MKHRQKNPNYRHSSSNEMQRNVLTVTSQFGVQQAKILACLIQVKVNDNTIMTW